jgi:hypothetical protein
MSIKFSGRDSVQQAGTAGARYQTAYLLAGISVLFNPSISRHEISQMGMLRTLSPVGQKSFKKTINQSKNKTSVLVRPPPCFSTTLPLCSRWSQESLPPLTSPESIFEVQPQRTRNLGFLHSLCSPHKFLCQRQVREPAGCGRGLRH